MIVIGGEHGDGFSVQAGEGVTHAAVADMLRQVVADLDETAARGDKP